MRVSENRVKQIRVNQGLGVGDFLKILWPSHNVLTLNKCMYM